jgi:hypothetical protein
MQLVAYGAQDVFLTGNPQITFFKVVYRRHTNFAVESIQQTFNGAADFGRKVTATISRNGDLITNVYLQVKLPKLADSGAKYVNSVGHALMKSIELEIGGQRIDKHYAEWLEIWSQLTTPAEKRDGYKEMVGMYDGTPEDATADRTYYIPLIFFFNRNPGLALPLIALQYHEVKINIDFEKVENLVYGLAADALGDKKITDCSLWVDYVYLDTDERRRFAQVSHEMLIEQLQFTGDESISANNGSSGRTEKFRMNFNHPVKELIWVYRSQEAEDAKDHFNFSMDSIGSDVSSWQSTAVPSTGLNEFQEPLASAKILLNGHDRMSDRPGSYFRLVQPYQHHTRTPSKHIYVYSFALKPEEHQPSGTCNFSRIDNATLSLTFNPKCDAGKVKIFAINNNVLRIMSGMGGLAYSN